jgi:oxygen-independent coproporphyrinogen-3 oxidase
MNTGAYVHIPFCAGKCRYCDFYSITDMSLIDGYLRALARNLRHIPRRADSVYFGGGTPSLLNPDQIYGLLSIIPSEAGAEITLEVNPDDASRDYFKEIKKAGINRLSIGVQSLDDGELAALGRRHDADTAVKAVGAAADAGFENISADIMLGLPFQDLSKIKKTLSSLTKLPLKHISAYMLGIAEKTPVYSDLSFRNALPGEDLTAEIYLETARVLSGAGFSQYEISNFARDGFESRHNLKYWLLEDYFGFGSMSHSCIGGARTVCRMTVEEYIAADSQDNAVTEEKAGGFEETAMLNIRLLKSGFDTSAYPDEQPRVLKNAEPLIKEGLLNLNEAVLTLTPKGCLVSNEIIVTLFL